MICDRCQTPIAATSADPVCITSLGTHHYPCMRAAWRDHGLSQAARQEAAAARRSAAARARWEAARTTEKLDVTG